MNLQEAKQIVGQLAIHTGNAMMPFKTPIKGFVIVPANGRSYSQMYKKMIEDRMSFNEAISPYSDDVTIVVYFDAANQADSKYCSYTQFLSSNNLDVQVPS